MNIQCLKEFDLGCELGQARYVPVSLGEEQAMLFVYSTQPNLDPWHELFNYPKDTLKMSLYKMDGTRVWTRDLGTGVIPGVWYCPFISFDLDKDGVDEIWFLNNLNPNLPFSLNARVLERVNPLTGETTGQWAWPQHTVDDTMSHSYRFYICGGYVHGEPVLITAQGTYRDMFLQAYNTGMQLRWDLVIPYSAGGPRAAHGIPILDFNEDGVDEIFYGERILSMDDGRELFCCDKDRYIGHSDLVAPFVDIKTGEKYIYTVREDDEREGEPRVVTYDDKGNRVWCAVDSVGHMHRGWIANIGKDMRKVAMAMRITRIVVDNAIFDSEPEDFYFDAVTGEQLEAPVPFKGSDYMPVDFNGDGISEFFAHSPIKDIGTVVDGNGKIYAQFGGDGTMASGKILNLPGEQVMVRHKEEGKVRIWGDVDAVESEYNKKRFANPYHRNMQHFMGTGYNHINSVISCTM